MATAPNRKPPKAAGKQQTSMKAASKPGDNGLNGASILSPFEEGLCAARESLLGAGDDIGDLERETRGCECSTREAIREAQPTEKKSAFQSGIDELQKKLCESATKYYNDCFELALSNRSELDGMLYIIAAKIGREKIDNPAEFARDFTAGALATFLRVTAIDGKKKAQEIDSNGRVRWFVRHACGDLSDLHPALYPESNKVFRLPQWFSHEWIIKAAVGRLARPPRMPAIDELSPLSLAETEDFILGEEEALIKKLHIAIARAHRIAVIKLGKTSISSGPLTSVIGVPQSVVDSSPRQTRKEKIVFIRRNGETFVQGESTPIAIANTFARLAETLRQMRAWVQTQKNGRVSVQEAKTSFRGTELSRAATDANWKDWIEIFEQKPSPRAKGVAVAFLAKKLGLELGTIEKYCAIGRKTKTTVEVTFIQKR